MGITKNALLRYQALDKCLKNNGRTYSIYDLLNKVNEVLLEDNPASSGVQVRQLRDDIRFMRSESGYNAPIDTVSGKGKKCYYCYSDSKFSINNSPLNETEAIQIKGILTLFQRFEGSPGFEWISEIGAKLEDSFGIKNEEDKVISFESNIDYVGYSNITPLFNAIVNKRVLKIEYTPFGKEPFQMEFHPYFLKQYNNRWFVFGLNPLNMIDTWNFALDRINNINENDVEYISSKKDWEYHFSDIIGVTKPENILEMEIELLFSYDIAPYIETKPLHQSQKQYPREDGLLVKYKLIPNYELEQLILSFGEKVKVISPITLKNKIQERIAKASELY